MNKHLAFLALLTTQLGTTAHAEVYQGNPTLTVSVERTEADLTDGSADLHVVRVHHCAGGYTDYTVDSNVDLYDGYDVNISSGDHCSVTVLWDSNIVMDGYTSSHGAFELSADDATTWMSLQGTSQSAELTQTSWVSGFIHGGNPKIVIDIQ